MGYTHYFTFIAAPPADAFGRLALDAKLLFAAADKAGIALASPDGDGDIVLSEGFIAFNGTTPQDYEGFVWPAQGVGFNFCKTQYRPYDAVVTAFLIRAKEIYGDAVEIESDGSWEDWKEGRTLYAAAFGTEAPNPGVTS